MKDWRYDTIKKPDNGKPIIVVDGGQWGSEAKGMVAAALCQRMNVDYAVRTGGVNAGHTVYYRGRAYKMQQLPTGWVNPNTNLVIGPGAYVNRGILDNEIHTINLALGPQEPETLSRLFIDHRAGSHYDHHMAASSRSGRHERIGATGKGCSEAVMDRIRLRGKIDGAEPFLFGGSHDTEKLLNNMYDDGKQILLEGTQGQLLDLLLGPWPYTTHKPCSPAQWLVENGLSPKLKYEMVMVCRTYPIRVAGNSGPLPGEMEWAELAQLTGRVGRKSLTIWEMTRRYIGMKYLAAGWLPMYAGELPNFDFVDWTPMMRLTYQHALSTFDEAVMKRVWEYDADAAMEILSFFETTTVTKKLRRLARWDSETMVASVRQIRPDYIVLTFLNYEFPELWGKTEIHDKALAFIRRREQELGVWIRYVTTGPESQHMVAVDEAGVSHSD